MTFIAENEVEEKIRALRPDGKEGVLMLKSIYDMIRLGILSTIYTDQHLTLTDLLEKCQQKCCNQRPEICWLILQVKLDLEARDLIRSFIPTVRKGMMHIKLTRSGRQQLQLELKDTHREIKLNRKTRKPTFQNKNHGE